MNILSSCSSLIKQSSLQCPSSVVYHDIGYYNNPNSNQTILVLLNINNFYIKSYLYIPSVILKRKLCTYSVILTIAAVLSLHCNTIKCNDLPGQLEAIMLFDNIETTFAKSQRKCDVLLAQS